MAHSHARSFSEDIKHFLRLCILPSRRDDISRIVSKLICIIFVPIMVFTSLWFSLYFYTLDKPRKNVLKARELWYDSSASTKEKLSEMKRLNSDFSLWLKIDETQIDTPVFQAKNNSYYLSHDQNRKKSKFGAPFVSAEDNLSEKSNDRNIVIYGNNIKNGEMFGTLKNLKKRSVLKKNPIISVTTERATESFFIFSVILLDSNSIKSVNGSFDVTKSYFYNNSDFNGWKKELETRSLIKTDISITSNDSFLTLIAPSDEFEGCMLAVLARKQRKLENAGVKLNPKTNKYVKFPDKMYKS